MVHFLALAYRSTERTEARRAETRERIVSAALELIAEGGYVAAPVAAVADHAGVAVGTVYRYFPSKSDLFAEVFRGAPSPAAGLPGRCWRSPSIPPSRRSASTSVTATAT